MASEGGCCGGGGSGGAGGGSEGECSKGSACCKSAQAQALPALGSVAAVETFHAMTLPELVRRFRRGVENFDRRMFDLTEEQLDQAFLPDAGVGRWPVRVVLGHIADADLVAVHRMRKIVAEDNPILTEWDEHAFVDQNLYGVGQGMAGGGVIGAFVAAIHVMRQWTGMWLASLTDAQLSRTGMHPSRGPQSVRDIAVYYTWHLENHAAFVNAKVERFLGREAPAQQDKAAPKAAGSCGSGCGCR